LIVTSGNATLLNRTLQSIAECELPSTFLGIFVIENGLDGTCAEACGRRYGTLNVRYQFSPGMDKCHAFSVAIQELPDKSLIVFSDDNIRFGSQTLMAYQRASQKNSERFFGGPFGCDYEQEPIPWIIPYLPLSAVGWNPDPETLDPQSDRFAAFNWAAFGRDLKRFGGFGPGIESKSLTRDPGYHQEMRNRMRAAGMVGQYVPGGKVYHFVPSNQCSVAWTVQRARRSGIYRGVARREQTIPEIGLHHWSNSVRLLASTAMKWLSSPIPASRIHFRAQYRQQCSLGYFIGFRQLPTESARRAA